MNADQPLGGGTNDRPRHETIAETGAGLPDEAVGPGQLSEQEQAELARAAEDWAEAVGGHPPRGSKPQE